MIAWTAVFAAIGLAAYSGVWRGWARSTQMFASTAPFAALFHAAGMASFTLAPLFARDSVLFTAAVWVGAAGNLVALLGLFWLPDVLLPTWWKQLARAETSSS